MASKALPTAPTDPRRSQDTQREDRTIKLKNQSSAPDLKAKRKVAQKTDVNGVIGLEALGVGSGLGLSSTSRSDGVRDQPDPRTNLVSSQGMKHYSPSMVSQPKVREEAPIRKPRISFSLGSRAKEKTRDKRQVASPEPGNLLKTSLSHRVAANPATNSSSPAPSGRITSPDANHFSPSLSSSPEVVTPGSTRAIPPLIP